MRHLDVEDYLDEVQALCTADTLVCGFSLGALVAAHLADRLPAAEIILFALNPHADGPDRHAGRLAFAADVARKGGAAGIASRLPPLGGPQMADARAQILTMAEESAAMKSAQTELALKRPGALIRLAKTRVPVRVVAGTEDSCTPIYHAHDAATAAPLGDVTALPGLGHCALVEDPGACIDALRENRAKGAARGQSTL